MKNLNKFISAFLLIPSFSFAATLPHGGEFIKGNGSIANQGNTLNISSQDLNNVIKWNGFDIGKDGKVIYTSKGYTDQEFAELMNQIEGALKK